jgi:hypothetical protein
VGGGQGEDGHQRRLLQGVAQARAADYGEDGDPGHVQPQQPDDPAVAPAQTSGVSSWPVGSNPGRLGPPAERRP